MKPVDIAVMPGPPKLSRKGKHHEYTVKHATMKVRRGNNQEAAIEVPGEAAYAFFASESGLQLATVDDEQGIVEQ